MKRTFQTTRAKVMTFNQYLKKHGVFHTHHRALSVNEADLVCHPPEDEKQVKVGMSRISGLGVIARKTFKKGERVCVVVTRDLMRTEIGGRYVNHSVFPNCRTEVDRKRMCIDMIAKRTISCGQELTVCYDRNDRIVKEFKALLKERFPEEGEE